MGAFVPAGGAFVPACRTGGSTGGAFVPAGGEVALEHLGEGQVSADLRMAADGQRALVGGDGQAGLVPIHVGGAEIAVRPGVFWIELQRAMADYGLGW